MQRPDVIWKAINKVLNYDKQANDLSELVISDSPLSGTLLSYAVNTLITSLSALCRNLIVRVRLIS